MPDSSDLSLQKKQLRQQLLALRQSIPAPQRLEAAQAIANHFADHPYLTYAASFAGYYPMRGELDVLPIFNRMAKFNKRTALPAIMEDGSLQFRQWKPGEPLEEGVSGTRHPTPQAETLIPEVILTPLLAVDKTGYRLGYGGGYYDRTMRQLRSEMPKPPLFIGVSFSKQEVDTLPLHDGDEQLDGVLTEQGVSMFR